MRARRPRYPQMLTSIQGVYRRGQVELVEVPGDVRDETQVIVTFLPSNEIELRAHGIDQAEAAELRARLTSFAEDWNQPEMDVYDNFDAAKSKT